MLDFDTAQQQLAAAGAPSGRTEHCPLHQARGRVLARDIIASIDLPPHDNSAMDGYAIRFADWSPDARLPVQQRCFAGMQPEPLQPGKTIRLFTGSVMPEGADTVVMQEDCTEVDGVLQIHQAPAKGAHVRYRGEDMHSGGKVLSAGTLIGPAEITVLASQGIAEVEVHARLRVGILTTGDELVMPGNSLAPSQIYNSNGFMLAALAQGLGAEVSCVLHAEDTAESLDAAFRQLLAESDLVLTAGGVSVGEKDLVKPAIEAHGGTLSLWRVNMKPGKPVALAHIGKTPVVCLPGNPVSAYSVFTLLVSPLIRNMQGRGIIYPQVQWGVFAKDIVNKDPNRIEFMRVQASLEQGQPVQLSAYAQQSSGVMSSLTWATGLARVAPGASMPAGSAAPYYPLALWLA